MRRRAFGAGLASLLLAGAAEADRVGAIEARVGGRLGVAALDAAGALRLHHRGEERFPLCSTHKVLTAAAVLARVDRGEDDLQRMVPIPAALPGYSPVTSRVAGAGRLSLMALCQASVTVSDNGAGNLLFEAVGGPGRVTAFLRSIGDGVTRLDRTEPTLNEAAEGDPRDTTTPTAMARTLRRLTVGEALRPAPRALLVGWMRACETGGARLRAGVPAGWKVGDKTGSGGRGTANDVGLLWRPGGDGPLVVTVFLTGSDADAAMKDAAIADVARLVARAD